MPLSKKKEKVDVTRGKGIELLSQVALTEDAQFEEVRRKRTGVKLGVPDMTKKESSESKAELGNEEDVINNEQDLSGKDIFSTVILQSLPSFTPPPQQSTSKPPPITEAINPPSILSYFATVFQFNNRVTALEKEVAELKKRILLKLKFCQRKNLTLPPPSVIQKMVKVSLKDAVLAKESSQPQSSYEAAATLIEFKLKKILIDKIDKSESYLAAPEHRECCEGLIKSYELDTTFFSTYGKVYSLKRSREDKDTDKDPFARSDRRLKKRKTSKDATPVIGDLYVFFNRRVIRVFQQAIYTCLFPRNTLAEYMILSGADNRPPMLEKNLYDFWKSRMEIYMQNREHKRMILKSVENGPLIWPTVEENGMTRTKKYADLSVAEKIQADGDMKETNIILQ
nr:hypothetical protein [Tanacetum cinerariifolium]